MLNNNQIDLEALADSIIDNDQIDYDDAEEYEFDIDPDQEPPSNEYDPTMCECGNWDCHGCPSHDELVAEGIIGEAGE